MSDLLPEEIYIEGVHGSKESGFWDIDKSCGVKYIRSDLVTQKNAEGVDLDGLTLDKLTDIVAAFGADNDSEDYPFNGEEYDIELVRFAFCWLLRGNSHRLQTIISSGHLATGKGGDGVWTDGYSTMSWKERAADLEAENDKYEELLKIKMTEQQKTAEPTRIDAGDLAQAIRLCEGKNASFILGGPSHTLVIQAARAHLAQSQDREAEDE